MSEKKVTLIMGKTILQAQRKVNNINKLYPGAIVQVF